MVGKFGQRLGGSNTYAAWDAYPLQDASANLETTLHEVALNSTDINERLVDGVNLLLGTEASRQAHHSVAQIAVKFKVCRQRDQFGRFDKMLNFEPGRSHGNPQGFGFVASGNSAAVIV